MIYKNSKTNTVEPKIHNERIYIVRIRLLPVIRFSWQGCSSFGPGKKGLADQYLGFMYKDA